MTSKSSPFLFRFPPTHFWYFFSVDPDCIPLRGFLLIWNVFDSTVELRNFCLLIDRNGIIISGVRHGKTFRSSVLSLTSAFTSLKTACWIHFHSEPEVSKSVLSIGFVLSFSYVNHIWKTQYEPNTQYRFGHLWLWVHRLTEWKLSWAILVLLPRFPTLPLKTR